MRSSKRPHATLDLKATDVTPPEETTEREACHRRPPMTQARLLRAERRRPKAPLRRTWPLLRPRAQVAASGRMLSHLAAGIVGGGLVYAGSAYLPLPGMPSPERTAQLEARLAALEKARRPGFPVCCNPRTTVATARAAGRAVADLSDKVAKESAAHDERIATANSRKEDQAEIDKLEERLNMIAQGANTSGRARAQLAAITGKISDLENTIASQIAALRKTILPMWKRVWLLPKTQARRPRRARFGLIAISRSCAGIRQAFAAGRGSHCGGQAPCSRRRCRQGRDGQAFERGFGTAHDGREQGCEAAGCLRSGGPCCIETLLARSESGHCREERGGPEGQCRAHRARLELGNLNRARARSRSALRGGAARGEEDRSRYAAQSRKPRALQGQRYCHSPDLKQQFRPVINAVLDASEEPAGASVLDKLYAGAKSVVRVRKVSTDPKRHEHGSRDRAHGTALEAGQLAAVIEEAKGIPQAASAPLQEWLDKVRARHSARSGHGRDRSQLKASLAGKPQPKAHLPEANETN